MANLYSKQEKQAFQLPYPLKLRHKNGGNSQNEVRFLKYIQLSFNSDSHHFICSNRQMMLPEHSPGIIVNFKLLSCKKKSSLLDVSFDMSVKGNLKKKMKSNRDIKGQK